MVILIHGGHEVRTMLPQGLPEAIRRARMNTNSLLTMLICGTMSCPCACRMYDGIERCIETPIIYLLNMKIQLLPHVG